MVPACLTDGAASANRQGIAAFAWFVGMICGILATGSQAIAEDPRPMLEVAGAFQVFDTRG
jgi:hypothetical protein